MRAADGRAVLIRRVAHGDEQCIQQFVSGLSSQSRYERFFIRLRELTQAMLEGIVQPDDWHGAALIAFAGDGSEEVVGMAQYDMVEPEEAEAAVIVAEGWRRVGLATALLADLEVIAAAAGIVCVSAEILRENAAALTLARHVGCVVDTSTREPYTLHVIKRMALKLNPTPKHRRHGGHRENAQRA